METVAAGPPSLVFQLAITLVALLILYGVMTIVDKSITAIGSAEKASAILIQDTTGDTSIIPQSLQSGAPLIYPSSNQPGGQEFAYSCFLQISSDTFSTSTAASCSASSSGSPNPTVLKHIFSKGTANSFPLMGPGLFCRGDKNTLRIYMNTVDSWNNFVEVDNIPVGDKWFHLVVQLQGSNMDIYINGNLEGTGTNSIGNTIAFDTSNGTHIGYSPINTSYMDGNIYSTRLYNRVLSAAQVLQNYNATKGRFGL